MFILNVTSILIAVTFKYQLPRFTIHKNEICYFKSNTFQAQCTFTTVTLLKCRLFFIIFNNTTCLFFMMFPIIKFKLIIQQVVSYIPGSSLILGSLLFLITLSSQVHECYLPKCSPFVYFPEALKSLLLFASAFYTLQSCLHSTLAFLLTLLFPFTPTQDAATIQDTDGFIPSPSFPSLMTDGLVSIP